MQQLRRRCASLLLSPAVMVRTCCAGGLSPGLQATRPASEGLVGVAKTVNSAAVIEVRTICWLAARLPSLSPLSPPDRLRMQINSETDFVARNESFQNLVSTCAHAVLEGTCRPIAGMHHWHHCCCEASATSQPDHLMDCHQMMAHWTCKRLRQPPCKVEAQLRML